MTASWDDERLARVVGGGGMEGLAMYGLYWRLLEIVAAQMDGKSPSCSVQYPVTRWSLLLSLRGSHVFSTLSRLSVTGVVTLERHDFDIKVTIPNLLKYRDEYARKSGQSPDNIPPRTEEEAEGEEEAENTISDATHPSSDRSLEISPEEAIYRCYPRKEAHGAAIKAIGKAVAKLVKGKDAARRGPMNRRDAQVLLYKAVVTYARSPVGQQPDRTKIPHPTTWFNQERWADDQSHWTEIQTIGTVNGGKQNGKIEATLNATQIALAGLRSTANGAGRDSYEAFRDPLFSGGAGESGVPDWDVGTVVEGKH